MLIGASYASNIADSDGLTDYFNTAGVNGLRDYVGGFSAYFHVAYANFFFDAEYMTATEDFDRSELANENGAGAQPSVWNFEFGYNWNWWKNLEIAIKYAGSDESVNLGFPEHRYGVAFNQTLFDGVTASLAYFLDDFEITDTRDKRDVLFGQVAVEF